MKNDKVKFFESKMNSSLESNMNYLNEKLAVNENFDLVYRVIEVGGKKACMYFVDGFCNQDIDMDMDKDTDTDIFIHNKKENATAGRAQSASPRREPTREESIEVCKRLRDSFLEMTGRDEGGEQKPNS